jgi:hypothetical protein
VQLDGTDQRIFIFNLHVRFQQTRAAWRNVFFITAGVYAFGTVVYGLFGSGERQPWAATAPVDEDIPINGASAEAGRKTEDTKEQQL